MAHDALVSGSHSIFGDMREERRKQLAVWAAVLARARRKSLWRRPGPNHPRTHASTPRHDINLGEGRKSCCSSDRNRAFVLGHYWVLAPRRNLDGRYESDLVDPQRDADGSHCSGTNGGPTKQKPRETRKRSERP